MNSTPGRAIAFSRRALRLTGRKGRHVIFGCIQPWKMRGTSAQGEAGHESRSRGAHLGKILLLNLYSEGVEDG
jgi:hypothetical protein